MKKKILWLALVFEFAFSMSAALTACGKKRYYYTYTDLPEGAALYVNGSQSAHNGKPYVDTLGELKIELVLATGYNIGTLQMYILSADSDEAELISLTFAETQPSSNQLYYEGTFNCTGDFASIFMALRR